ncbi:hypothetical protein JVT61DRAFT_6842 [Boletus reticuloceps]|uniref:Arf-GAP domain-containing protein n=1 Tax=Boletus reticuloceps TaxID=495285 RepID=A0A8I2YKB1_9AGAM|nr:hypothetical protein JVT61DRAFT_6842 [Boletus reticuloceps]
MYKPDKATTERNARILRELVKQPDNKLCADCKRNGEHTTTVLDPVFPHGRPDPRWASWNLGVYLCIRCSGIHRGMGTHISRVKSIDLDMWTPEQMESIQRWGNCRANMYWEAHLKAGHVPLDHKMESFIRSKYESRRWAMDGPPPSDPSVLDKPAESASNGAPASADAALFDTSPAPGRPAHAPTASLSAARPVSPSVHTPSTFRQNTAHSYSQSRQLLSAAVAGRVQVPAAPSQSSSESQPQPQSQPLQQQQQKVQDDLFSLDFHAPPVSKPTPPQLPTKDVKQDILSLFAAAPAPTPVPAAPAQQAIQPSNAFGQFASHSSRGALGGVSGAQTYGHAQAQPSIDVMGTTGSGTGLWGASASSGWNGNAALANNTTNVWGAPANPGTNTTTNAFGNTSSMFNALNTTDIWGGRAGTATVQTQANGGHGLFATPSAPASKKDDMFGDLWGDFK